MTFKKLKTFTMVVCLLIAACNKKPDQKLQPTPDTTKPGSTTPTTTPVGSTIQKGALSIGAPSAKLMALWSSTTSQSATDLVKNLITSNPRFANDSPKEVLVRIQSLASPDGKKIIVSTGNASVDVLSIKDGKASSLGTKDNKVSLKIADQDVAMAWDNKRNAFVSSGDVGTPVADAIPTSIAKTDIIETEGTSTLLAPVGLTTQNDEPVTEITLDTTKDPIESDEILFSSSYKGAEGDAAKPECFLFSQNGIGDTKPVLIYGVLDLGEADHKMDFSKINKADVQKIASGEMDDVEIVCVKGQEDKSPSFITTTFTQGYKIKVVNPAPAATPKAEIKDRPTT